MAFTFRKDKQKASGKTTTPDKDGRVFVDLSVYDVDGDTTVMKVRTIRPTVPLDIENVGRAIASKSTVFIDLEEYEDDKEEFLDAVKVHARTNSCHVVVLNSLSILVAPQNVEIKNQRIRR